MRNLTDRIAAKVPAAGSVWLWAAIDADTKLVPSFMVGSRSASEAFRFVNELASRLRYKVQMTTDGHRPYLEAIEAAFGGNIDYAMHTTLRVTPAMAAGISTRLMDVTDLVNLLIESEREKAA